MRSLRTRAFPLVATAAVASALSIALVHAPARLRPPAKTAPRRKPAR